MAWTKKLFLVCLVLQMTFVYPDDSETDDSETEVSEKATTDDSETDGLWTAEMKDYLQCPSGSEVWSVLKNMCYGYYGARTSDDRGGNNYCSGIGARDANISTKEIMDHVTKKIHTWEIPNHWVAHILGKDCVSLQGRVKMTYLSEWACERKERITCEVSRDVSATDKEHKGCLLPESVPSTKWTVFGKKCFLFTRVLASATEGFRHCQDNFNGTLPTVENPAELRFVAGNAKDGQWVDPSGGIYLKQEDLESCTLLQEEVSVQVESYCSQQKLRICEVQTRNSTASDFRAIRMKGKEYLFVNIRDTSLQAKARCKIIGGELASESLPTDVIDSIYDGAEDFGSTPFWMGRNSEDKREDRCPSVSSIPVTKSLPKTSCNSYKRILCVRAIKEGEWHTHYRPCKWNWNVKLVEKWQNYNDERCYYLLKIPSTWSRAQSICQNSFGASLAQPEEYNDWMILMEMTSMEMWISTKDTKELGSNTCATLKRGYQTDDQSGESCDEKKYSVCEVTPTDNKFCHLPPTVTPKGWRSFGKRCYFYVEEKRKSSSIQDYCKNSFGGTVAFVDSMETASSLVSLISLPVWVNVDCDNTFSTKTASYVRPLETNITAATMLVSGSNIVLRMNQETDVVRPFICSVPYRK